MKHYYNTNKEFGNDLISSNDKNKSQQERVLEYFFNHPINYLSVEKIHENVMPKARMTSAQRCVTNLTEQGFLEKTENFTTSSFGKKVHTWRLITPQKYKKGHQRNLF